MSKISDDKASYLIKKAIKTYLDGKSKPSAWCTRRVDIADEDSNAFAVIEVSKYSIFLHVASHVVGQLYPSSHSSLEWSRSSNKILGVPIYTDFLKPYLNQLIMLMHLDGKSMVGSKRT